MNTELHVDQLARMVESTPVESLPELAGELARAQALLALRLSAPRPPEHHPPDQLLTVEDVATRCRMSRAWVYENQVALGGRKLGKAVRFSERAVTRYLNARER